MTNVEAGPRSPVLIDTFSNIRTKQITILELNEDSIKFYPFNSKNIPDTILSIKDVAGSRVAKSPKSDDQSSFLLIYAYIKNSKNEISKRKRVCYELAFTNFSTYEENSAHISKWFNEIDRILKKRLVTSIGSSKLKPFLVFVNPKAGSGRAKNIYFERVSPIFAEASISDVLVLTQKQNFARDYIKNCKLEDFAGILVISGDGLIHEVINGLMERQDWETAIKTPLGHIPGGSANALSCCVAHLTNEQFKNLSLEVFAAQTTFNLTKAISTPMDLVAYELCDKKIVHSFLAFEWAIIADVDLESEKYRYLGGLRFAVGAVKRILNLRIYRGKLSFLPTDEHKNYTPKNRSINIKRQPNETDISAINPSIRETNSSRPNFKYLPELDQPIPSDWLTIEENFVMLLISYLPLISPDFVSAPDSKFNDGNMHLVFIKEGITKTQMLKLFTNTETGDHLNNELVEYVKIKAFRLEPIGIIDSNGQVNTSNGGIMMVDGERVPTGVIQGEIKSSMANILANIKD